MFRISIHSFVHSSTLVHFSYDSDTIKNRFIAVPLLLIILYDNMFNNKQSRVYIFIWTLSMISAHENLMKTNRNNCTVRRYICRETLITAYNKYYTRSAQVNDERLRETDGKIRDFNSWLYEVSPTKKYEQRNDNGIVKRLYTYTYTCTLDALDKLACARPYIYITYLLSVPQARIPSDKTKTLRQRCRVCRRRETAIINEQ
jgi:hypothetical protein